MNQHIRENKIVRPRVETNPKLNTEYYLPGSFWKKPSSNATTNFGIKKLNKIRQDLTR
jgi:hypothetical protein